MVVVGYHPVVSPNKSSYGLEVEVLVVPVGVFGVIGILRCLSASGGGVEVAVLR